MPPAEKPTETAPSSDVRQPLDELEAILRRHPRVLIGAGAAAVVACGILLYATRARQRRERHREAFLALAARVFGPAPGAEPAASNGALKSSLKKATAALVEAAGRELGRRALLAVTTRSTPLEHEGETAPA